jgi:hypothetical protein
LGGIPSSRTTELALKGFWAAGLVRFVGINPLPLAMLTVVMDLRFSLQWQYESAEYGQDS